MPRKLPGRQRRGDKWRIVVRVNGKLRVSPWGNESDTELVAWRTKQIGKFGKRQRVAGSLLADIEALLRKPEIAALKYVGHLRRMLLLWVEALGGDRPRAAIETEEIEAVIQGWLKRFAEPTVYHRRSALLTLYTVLDGPAAVKNPVKATTCPKAWEPVDQSVPFATLRAIVDAMPDVRYVKKGITQPSAAKLACNVIIAVGLRAVDLLKVKARDFRVGADGRREFLWPASEKGQGVTAKWTPLSAEGEAGFDAYVAAGMPRFNPEAISHSFKRAARRIDGDDTPIHLYSMRHSIGADTYRVKGDLATVGRMLNHALGSRATAQYALGAHADVDRAAVDAVSAARREQAPEPKVTEKVTEARKPQRKKLFWKAS
jgi:integrase